jgi:hypothetical protein
MYLEARDQVYIERPNNFKMVSKELFTPADETGKIETK